MVFWFVVFFTLQIKKSLKKHLIFFQHLSIYLYAFYTVYDTQCASLPFSNIPNLSTKIINSFDIFQNISRKFLWRIPFLCNNQPKMATTLHENELHNEWIFCDIFGIPILYNTREYQLLFQMSKTCPSLLYRLCYCLNLFQIFVGLWMSWFKFKSTSWCTHRCTGCSKSSKTLKWIKLFLYLLIVY